jgi:GT2 family glycosyltransferase
VFVLQPHVSILVVNWKGWRDTIECLESIFQIKYLNYDVVLLDNGSDDESIIKIREYCAGKIKIKSKFFKYNSSNKPIKLIEYTRKEAESGKITEKRPALSYLNKNIFLIKNEINYGFAKGNNIGIEFSMSYLDPDFIFLLNNDTVIRPDTLTKIVNTIKRNNKIGIIGPKICYYDESDIIWSSGGFVNKFTGGIGHRGMGKHVSYHQGLEQVDYITGCALMINADIIREIGLLDERYFLYFEETDWNMRCQKHGYVIVCDNNAIIYHKPSTSFKKIPSLKHYYLYRNKPLFIKNNIKTRNMPIFIFTYLVQLIMSISKIVIKKQNKLSKYALQGISDYLLGRFGPYKR